MPTRPRPAAARTPRRRLAKLALPVLLGTAMAALPAAAAPIFVDVDSVTASDCASSGAVVTSSGLAGRSVAGGQGIALSGAASSTGTGPQCLAIAWRGSLAGSVEPAGTLTFDLGIDVAFTGTADDVSTQFQFILDHEPVGSPPFERIGVGYVFFEMGTGTLAFSTPLTVVPFGALESPDAQYLSYLGLLEVRTRASRSSTETLSASIAANRPLSVRTDGRTSSVPTPGVASLAGVGMLALLAIRRRTAAPRLRAPVRPG
jgi:hypothetical protein